MITKKEFKERCGFHRFVATDRILNAIYFDWKSERTATGFIVGYKYMVKAYTRECSKAELLNQLYLWVNDSNWTPPYFLDIKYAETDEQRFKPPVSMSI